MKYDFLANLKQIHNSKQLKDNQLTVDQQIDLLRVALQKAISHVLESEFQGDGTKQLRIISQALRDLEALSHIDTEDYKNINVNLIGFDPKEVQTPNIIDNSEVDENGNYQPQKHKHKYGRKDWEHKDTIVEYKK